LKSITVPSALLTNFPKKRLASDIIFTKLSTKTLLLWHCRVTFEYQGLFQNTPHRSYCFLSMFKLRCKRHYRNLATYSWYTTWLEHVTKTAPARGRHSVGGGGAPISCDRRRWRQKNVGGAAAAAHSSSRNSSILTALHIVKAPSPSNGQTDKQTDTRNRIGCILA